MDSREKQDLIDEFGPISESENSDSRLEPETEMTEQNPALTPAEPPPLPASAGDDAGKDTSDDNAPQTDLHEPPEIIMEIEEPRQPGKDKSSESGKNKETLQNDAEEPDDQMNSDEKTTEIIYDFIGADPENSDDRIGMDPTEAELADTRDKLLHLAAEFENFKKRRIKERDEQQKYANEHLIKDLLPVLDNLQRALESARQTGQGQVITSGLDLVIHEFLRVLSHEGVEPIIAMGKPFDPAYQEALQSLETTESEPGTVVGEILRGYTIYGRVLRAALVVVAHEPQSSDN